MPTFSAIALDRMIEPGASTSAETTVPSTNSQYYYSKPPISKVDKAKSLNERRRTFTRPKMSPALYATPDAIPLPNSPSSFPPSPYIINHKSRGPPRLLKSSSEANVASQQKTVEDEAADVKASPRRKSTSFSFPISEPTEEDFGGVVDGPFGSWSGKSDLDSAANGLERENNLPEPVFKAEKESESEDFYDPGESASFTSNAEVEGDAGEDGSQKLATTVGEFYDAWDGMYLNLTFLLCYVI